MTTTAFHRTYEGGEDIRAVFSSNLRYLVDTRFSSRFEASRALDINRTQLNRYLYGESTPTTEPLLRILAFFEVDGRILSDPLPEAQAAEQDETEQAA